MLMRAKLLGKRCCQSVRLSIFSSCSSTGTDQSFLTRIWPYSYPLPHVQASSTTPKFNKSMTGKLKRVEKYKKSESRRQERLHLERRLQSNLDSYVTRAVTELTYRMPEEAEAAAGPESRQPTPGAGDPVHMAVTSEAMAKERFPIPVEVENRLTSYFPRVPPLVSHQSLLE